MRRATIRDASDDRGRLGDGKLGSPSIPTGLNKSEPVNTRTPSNSFDSVVFIKILTSKVFWGYDRVVEVLGVASARRSRGTCWPAARSGSNWAFVGGFPTGDYHLHWRMCGLDYLPVVGACGLVGNQSCWSVTGGGCRRGCWPGSSLLLMVVGLW
ncbi:hypothetical protein Dimus_013485, partial [Dionaea muscipula]